MKNSIYAIQKGTAFTVPVYTKMLASTMWRISMPNFIKIIHEMRIVEIHLHPYEMYDCH